MFVFIKSAFPILELNWQILGTLSTTAKRLQVLGTDFGASFL